MILLAAVFVSVFTGVLIGWVVSDGILYWFGADTVFGKRRPAR